MTADEGDLAAGAVAGWLSEVQVAIRGDHGDHGVAVPCGTCTACCRASQFVHIGPDETDALAHIPPQLRFPAPGRPPGHVVLGYDEHGRCPMLIDDRCSIYAHRPRACRSYDCRVFAATGLLPEGPERAEIAHRAQRWRFDVADPTDRAALGAVRAAAAFLAGHPDVVAEAGVSALVTPMAVLAVELADLFLGPVAPTGTEVGPTVVEPDPELVRAEVRRRSAPGRAQSAW